MKRFISFFFSEAGRVLRNEKLGMAVSFDFFQFDRKWF